MPLLCAYRASHASIVSFLEVLSNSSLNGHAPRQARATRTGMMQRGISRSPLEGCWPISRDGRSDYQINLEKHRPCGSQNVHEARRRSWTSAAGKEGRRQGAERFERVGRGICRADSQTSVDGQNSSPEIGFLHLQVVCISPSTGSCLPVHSIFPISSISLPFTSIDFQSIHCLSFSSLAHLHPRRASFSLQDLPLEAAVPPKTMTSLPS